MARWLIALLLVSVALGQTQFPKFEPNDPAAWQNAIRNPAPLSQGKDFTGNQHSSSHFSLPPLKSGFLGSPASSYEPSRFMANVCAIPLTRIPADPKIDPGIGRGSNVGAEFLDNMPHAKVMPVCGEEQPRR